MFIIYSELALFKKQNTTMEIYPISKFLEAILNVNDVIV